MTLLNAFLDGASGDRLANGPGDHPDRFTGLTEASELARARAARVVTPTGQNAHQEGDGDS